MPERVIALSQDVAQLVHRSVAEIQRVTGTTRMLAVNALIEAARAGEAGKGFAVVAKDVEGVSSQVRQIADQLGEQLAGRVNELTDLGKSLVASVRGTRLADLSLNMIEIIDRNLYERSCDVRWWATDAAAVSTAAEPTPANRQLCSSRLDVILQAYTVYLDIWVCDLQGNVLASGRPRAYPKVKATNVAREEWFLKAAGTHDGNEFAVADIAVCPALENRTVATYATAIRAGGDLNARPIGVLGIFFDWQTQSQAVVKGVRLSEEEKKRTRCMLLDSKGRVIASSDGKGVLTETFNLKHNRHTMGNYTDNHNHMVGFALTPGYETYKGLGWYGAIQQAPQTAAVTKKAA